MAFFGLECLSAMAPTPLFAVSLTFALFSPAVTHAQTLMMAPLKPLDDVCISSSLFYVLSQIPHPFESMVAGTDTHTPMPLEIGTQQEMEVKT